MKECATSPFTSGIVTLNCWINVTADRLFLIYNSDRFRRYEMDIYFFNSFKSSLLNGCCRPPTFLSVFFFFVVVAQGASALFDMIEYYESATRLNISFNKHIGTRGWQAAAHMMRKVSSGKHLPSFLCFCAFCV